LVPVNWENIQTSRAQHFHALQDNWLDCVRKAQYEGHPGDILTLADDAPTRLHRTKILYEAAVALINMCRYPAAEKVLREVIASEPNSPNAQLQLARSLSHQNKTEEAEHALRSILRQHEGDDPHAGDLLGQVFRHLWHLAWTKANPEDKMGKARDTSQLANMAISSFIRAFRFDARAYYAGFNALILGALLKDLIPAPGPRDLPVGVLDLQELATVIEFIANSPCLKQRKLETLDSRLYAINKLRAGLCKLLALDTGC
jgi:tetratricopeptide (TPR) repeat protein